MTTLKELQAFNDDLRELEDWAELIEDNPKETDSFRDALRAEIKIKKKRLAELELDRLKEWSDASDKPMRVPEETYTKSLAIKQAESFFGRTFTGTGKPVYTFTSSDTGNWNLESVQPGGTVIIPDGTFGGNWTYTKEKPQEPEPKRSLVMAPAGKRKIEL